MDQNDGIWAAAVTAAVGLGGILGKTFGTPKERAEPVERAAELALRMAAQERDETAKVRVQRDDCHERLDMITGELDAIRVELRECEKRDDQRSIELYALRREQAWNRRAIEALQRRDSDRPKPT